jgi:hypothetical protein
MVRHKFTGGEDIVKMWVGIIIGMCTGNKMSLGIVNRNLDCVGSM